MGREWRQVCYSADCDEDGVCPKCGMDYAESDCPGPTQDGMEYEWRAVGSPRRRHQ